MAEKTASAPEWILHATGSLAPDTAGQCIAENLNAIRERCGKGEDSRSFYDALGKMDVHFGPSFRSVTRVFRGTDEALVEFVLPSDVEADADRYQIHPVVLDACFQSVVATLLTASHGPDAIYLPAALDELRLLGDPRKLTLAHARLRRAQCRWKWNCSDCGCVWVRSIRQSSTFRNWPGASTLECGRSAETSINANFQLAVRSRVDPGGRCDSECFPYARQRFATIRRW